MPTINDASRKQGMSESELAAFRVGADADFQVFWDVLEWRPIAEYDREAAPPVIVRDDGDNWEFAAWETRHPFHEEDAQPDDDTPMWRDCQESREGQPIGFEPRWFALVSGDWAVALTAD